MNTTEDIFWILNKYGKNKIWKDEIVSDFSQKLFGKTYEVRGVARGGAEGARAPLAGIWQISKPYSNQRGQIMPLTILPAPPDSKSYLHLCY